MLSRLTIALPCLVVAASANLSAQFQEPGDLEPLPAEPPAIDTRARPSFYDRLRRLMSDKQKVRKRAAKALADADPAVLLPLVDAYFFIQGDARNEAREVLEALSGKQLGSRYRDWFEYVGGRTDLEPPPYYADWKGELFGRIDRQFGILLRPGGDSLQTRGFDAEYEPGRDTRLLNPDASVPFRLQEVQWGGVPWDGIPAINDPEVVGAGETRFMRDSDTVFGVTLGGEHRAYPVKVLSWHELLNDTVGGEPVTLSFCTLCGSGILYSAVSSRGGPLRFGTSGLLYRSNKLMFDHETRSLWSNLTGEAVVGRYALLGAKLTMLPMTLTTWADWRQRHPDTTIMRPDPAAAQRFNYRYVEGAADAARAGVEFPVWQKNDILERNDQVYALLVNGEAKAYPLAKLRTERLVHDTLGGLPIVLVVDGESGAVRAYERRGLTFRTPSAAPLSQLQAGDGSAWTMTEKGLVPEADGEMLPRVPGHVAFWFGWYAFYPETDVF